MIENLHRINLHIFYTHPFPLYSAFNLHPIKVPNSTSCRPTAALPPDHAPLHALLVHLLLQTQSALSTPTSEDVLKLGTSQGEIWNHSAKNYPFPFSILHFRTEKKLPFRFSTTGNNPAFVIQVVQTGFIALCTIHSNITIFAPLSPCTLSLYSHPQSPTVEILPTRRRTICLLSNWPSRARGKRNSEFLVTSVLCRRLKVQETLPLINPPCPLLYIKQMPASRGKNKSSISCYVCAVQMPRDPRDPLS